MKFISSADVFDWLSSFIDFKRGQSAKNSRLERMETLATLAGHPERSAPVIHVAGSKGKGSVTGMMSAILEASGMKTARFTSPHVSDFRERVSAGARFFEEAVYIRAGEELVTLEKALRDTDHYEAPTFFELITMFFFLCARLAESEIMVVETGMGGRLDATNIVTPLVSVITLIELEHTESLGSTIAAIAGEKAGIIKEGRPLILAEQPEEALAVFKAHAAEKHAALYYFPDVATISDTRIYSEGVQAPALDPQGAASSLYIEGFNAPTLNSGSDRQSMLTKERRSLWFDWFDWLTNRRLLWFDRLTNRLSNRLVSWLVSLSNQSNHRHRSNASAYFVDHFLNSQMHPTPSLTEGTSFTLRSNLFAPLQLSVPIPGAVQAHNAGLAVLALKTAFPSLSDGAIHAGLQNFTLPARFERLMDTPPLIIDGAHTPHSIAYCAETFALLYGNEGLLIFGCIAGKDIRSMARTLIPRFSRVIITTPGSFKKSNPDEVHAIFQEESAASMNKPTVLYIPETDAAIEQTLALMKEKNLPVLGTGSFYLTADIRAAIRK